MVLGCFVLMGFLFPAASGGEPGERMQVPRGSAWASLDEKSSDANAVVSVGEVPEHMEFASAIHTNTQMRGEEDASLPHGGLVVLKMRSPEELTSSRAAQMAAAVEAKFQLMSQIMRQKAVRWQIRDAGDPWFSRAPPQGFLQRVMSEPEPHADAAYTGSVRNMVGSTFQNITLNPEKDVFVNCYAPWCGHCQNFKAPYMMLAKKVKHVETLEITQIDCSQNSMPGVPPPSGFPLIFFCPAGKEKDASKCIVYQGDRTPDAMLWFLHKHATYNFTDTPPPRNATVDDGEAGLLGPNDGDDL